MAMNANSTNIRERTKRDDNAADYSVNGLSVPLQFVINNEPHLPRNLQQKKLVRSHAKRQSCAVEKRRNTMPVQRREILQKRFNQSEAQSKFGITRADANVTSILSKSFLGSKVAVSLSVGSEPDAYLTDGSSYLGCEDSEAPSLSTSPELDTVSSCPLIDRYKFDRWIFDTTSPYALLQDEGAPALLLSARTWPFPKPIGAEKPKFSIFMPSRILPVLNLSPSRGCMHKSALVVPHIINSPEYFAFKVGTIQWINNRLDNVSIGTGGATIGSILLLVNFEVGAVFPFFVLGNGLLLLEYMPLEVPRLLQPRLISNFQAYARHILARILVIDLLVGVLSTTQPRFSQPTLFPEDLLSLMYPKIADSPLTAGRTLKIALKNSPFGERGIKYLQRAQVLTMLRLSGVSLSRFVDEAGFSEAETEHHNSKLFEIIQQTSEIYFGALQPPSIPFSSPTNRVLIKGVCRAVESPANDDVWDQYPGIFVWVLLVGCATAEQGSTEYNYFVCLLIKVALGAGYGWLAPLTEAVKSFIRVKALAGG